MIIKKLLLTILGITALSFAGQEQNSKLLSPGTTAPTFSLPSLSGERVSLRVYNGDTLTKPHVNKTRHVVILSFWATYCLPCQKEIPELMKFAANHVKDSVKLFAISIDKEGASIVDPFVKEKGYTLEMLLDPYKKTAERYGVKSLPALFVIDPFGVIRYSSIGYDERVSLTDKLEEILADARAGKNIKSVTGSAASVAVEADQAEEVPAIDADKIPAKSRWDAIIKLQCGTPAKVVADSLGVTEDTLRKWYDELKNAAMSLWNKQ